MSRLLAVGHVTWDRVKDRDVLGGSAAYAALAAHRLGWRPAVLTSAALDFEPPRDLPGITTFVAASSATTRFENRYDSSGARKQFLLARAENIDLARLPDLYRHPDVLLLGPVAGELPRPLHQQALRADVVGVLAQGWLRDVDQLGEVHPRSWDAAAQFLAGVHVLFASEQDLPGTGLEARDFLDWVPIVALTHGWRGTTLFTGDAEHRVPSLPRVEVDPTGAGDVFATAFLVRYHECQDPLEAASFATCAASCVVEGVGASTLGDREEIARRLESLDRLIDEGDWDERRT